ncbi:MAG: ParB/RepB/Spo0J family partition protein [Acidobacteria bacterium]|nr:ParB/RepB/Spo0J family partition protein [Acidobacteriota bacterium]
MVAHYNPFPDKNKQGVTGVVEVWDVERLKPNPLNPRLELQANDPEIINLANSIRAQGLISPLTVTPQGWVVAGHRRRLACIVAEVGRVRVIVQNLTEQQQLEIMVVENVQRQDLSPYEEAVAYQRLLDSGMSQMAIARATGVVPAHIQGRRTILKLQPEVQALYRSRDMPTAIIPYLARVQDGERQRRYAVMASRRALPIARLQKLIEASEGEAQEKYQRKTHEPILAGVQRKDAVALLRREPDRAITYAELYAVLETQCCACGLRDYSATTENNICASCPLPQLIKAITEHHA